jgi:hypothetical protein
MSWQQRPQALRASAPAASECASSPDAFASTFRLQRSSSARPRSLRQRQRPELPEPLPCPCCCAKRVSLNRLDAHIYVSAEGRENMRPGQPRCAYDADHSREERTASTELPSPASLQLCRRPRVLILGKVHLQAMVLWHATLTRRASSGQHLRARTGTKRHGALCRAGGWPYLRQSLALASQNALPVLDVMPCVRIHNRGQEGAKTYAGGASVCRGCCRRSDTR